METTVTENKEKNTYEFTLRLLGNEVIAVGLKSSSDSNKWIALSVLTAFCFLTILGAYGDKLLALVKGLT